MSFLDILKCLESQTNFEIQNFIYVSMTTNNNNRTLFLLLFLGLI